MGNCGVGVAPCRASDRELLAQDLVNVEGMSKEVLTAGIKWEWESFPEYMEAADRRAPGINLAFLVPLAPLRTYVMGTAGSDRAATADETREMAHLIEEAMEAGAVGWSTSASLAHIGHNGKPLAARLASRDELAAYGGVLKKLGRGTIELALTKRYASLADDEYETLEFLLDHSERPVTYLSLHTLREKPEGAAQALAKAAPLLKRHARPQILTRPMMSELSLKTPFQLSAFKATKPIFNQPVEQQMAVYRDPAFRKALQQEIDAGSKLTGVVGNIGIYKVQRADLKSYEGRLISEVAEERGVSHLECMFDFALEDGLATKFIIPRTNTDRERIPDLLCDSERTLIGISDAGAHVDMFCEAGYTTWLLGHWVREQKAISLEHAVKRITSEPADYFGLADRGRLKAGLAADVVVFDPERVSSPARGAVVHDLPTGAGRLYSKSEGVEKVIVNGKLLFDSGRHTGAYPGRVLRPH